MSRAVVLGTHRRARSPWIDPLDAAGALQVDPAAADELRGAVSSADCVLVDGDHVEAVDWLRAARRADAAVQAVIVARPAARRRVERRVLFAPGLGEVWIVSPDEVDASLIERAAEVTRRRRRHAVTRTRLADELARFDHALPQRTIISDAYLAALLEAAPDPVLSADPAGRVLSWNPACERVLGFPRREAVGRPLAELVPAAAAALRHAAREDSGEPVRVPVEFDHAAGHKGTGEVIIVPIEVAGESVRAVILHDLTDQRRARAELEDQAAKLQEVNEALREQTAELERALGARSRFYAAMSHELRTPLNAILGYQALLLEDLLGPLTESQRDTLTRAHRAARHLTELVDDALDLARIEAGRLRLQEVDTAFPELIQELLGTLRSPDVEDRPRISVEGAEESHVIRTDPRRVRQILLNLLSNALKYGRGRPVRVRWAAAPDGGVVVEVEDEGPGIRREDLERIFEEFVQLSADEGNGTGLGLAIARQLATVLGGRLEAESSPGQGSTFRLILPPRSGIARSPEPGGAAEAS